MSLIQAVLAANMTDLEKALSERPQIDALFDGKTALYHAVEKNFLGVVTRLLQAGASPDIKHGGTGRTPLIASVINKNSLVTQALIDAGAKPDIQDSNGLTALHHVAITGDQEILELLVDAGANPDIQNSEGNTPLFCAVNQGRSVTAKKLLDAGADPDIQCGNSGWTALHMAVQRDAENCVKVLIEAKTNPRIRLSDGRTASDILTTGGIKNLLNSYTRDWTPPADKARPKPVARPAPDDKKTMSTKTQENIRRLDEMMAHRRGSGGQPVPAPAQTADSSPDNEWKKISDSTIARVSNYADIGYRLTELFNFETRQHTQISSNLETGAECMALREFDAIRDKTILSRAMDAFARAGGKADPHVIDSGYITRKKEPLLKPPAGGTP